MPRLVVIMIWFLLAEPLFGRNPITISDDPDFSQRILPNIEMLELAPTDERPTVYTITQDRFAERFNSKGITTLVMMSDTFQWLRIKVFNPSDRTVPLVFANHFSFMSGVVTIDRAPWEMRRFGARSDGATVGLDEATDVAKGSRRAVLSMPEFVFFYPHTVVNFPPGASIFYVGINTMNLPLPMAFTLESKARFDKSYLYKLIFIVTIGGALSLLSMFSAVLFVATRMPLYLYYQFTIICYSSLELISIGFMPFLVFYLGYGIYSIMVLVFSAKLMLVAFDITRENYPRTIMAHRPFVLISLLVLGSQPFISAYHFLLALNIPLFLLMLLIISTMTTLARHQPLRAAVFAAAFIPSLCCSMLYTMAVAGVLGGDEIFYSLRLFFAVNNSICMTFFFAERLRSVRRARDIFESSLQSVMSAQQIRRIDQKKLEVDLKPVSRYVTVMFIDIVGYSLSLRDRLPEENFYVIKELLHKITSIIHKYDGVIDKSLGDGCLCFFGYDLVGGHSIGHEKLGVNCALEIQRQVLADINNLGSNEKCPVFPLRIGINTADVCIGNMGDKSRFDLTMTGDGVILAARFESSCEPFKVMIGRATYQGLGVPYEKKGFYSRLVPIKHQATLEECFEINPFEDNETQLHAAKTRYWNSVSFSPKEERYEATGPELSFESPYGKMAIVNFSISGLCLRNNIFLGRGTKFELNLTDQTEKSAIDIISPILVEVVWGTPNRDQTFLHGVEIKGLNRIQKDLVFDFFCRKSLPMKIEA